MGSHLIVDGVNDDTDHSEQRRAKYEAASTVISA